MNALFCKPLIRKELGHTWLVASIGAVVIGLMCWTKIPSSIFVSSNLSYQFLTNIGIAAAVLALLLGVMQAAIDLRPDRRGFLLHRPVSLRAIFTAKLIGGFIAYTFALALPLVLTAMRLASLGPERIPTGAAELLPLALAAPVLFLMHPAAMWATYRSASILGTRALPLLFAGVSIVLSLALLMGSTGTLLWVGYPLVVLVCFVITIHATWHAFSHQTFLPPASADDSMSASRAIGLFIGCVAAVVTLMVMLAAWMIPTVPASYAVNSLAFDTQGQAWEVQTQYQNGGRVNDRESNRTGRRIELGQADETPFAPLPDGWTQARNAQTLYHREPEWHQKFVTVQNVSSDATPYAVSTLVQNDGRLLYYEMTMGLIATITPNGMFGDHETPTGRFERLGLLTSMRGAGKRSLTLTPTGLWVADDGIYQLDLEAQTVTQIVDTPVENVAIEAPRRRGGTATLWIMHQRTLSRYLVSSASTDVPLESPSDPVIVQTQTYPLPKLVAKKAGEFAMPSLAGIPTISTIDDADGNTAEVILTQQIGAFHRQVIRVAMESGDVNSFVAKVPPASYAFGVSGELYLFPPGLTGLATLVTYLLDAEQWRLMREFNPVPLAFIVWCLVHSAIAAALAYWYAGTRWLETKTRVTWAILGLLVGVSVLPAILAIHAKPVTEFCPSCDRKRRIDAKHCGQCGAEWSTTPVQRFEIVGPRSGEQTVAPELAL